MIISMSCSIMQRTLLHSSSCIKYMYVEVVLNDDTYVIPPRTSTTGEPCMTHWPLCCVNVYTGRIQPPAQHHSGCDQQHLPPRQCKLLHPGAPKHTLTICWKDPPQTKRHSSRQLPLNKRHRNTSLKPSSNIWILTIGMKVLPWSLFHFSASMSCLKSKQCKQRSGDTLNLNNAWDKRSRASF